MGLVRDNEEFSMKSVSVSRGGLPYFSLGKYQSSKKKIGKKSQNFFIYSHSFNLAFTTS